jgi:hypothetical protein
VKERGRERGMKGEWEVGLRTERSEGGGVLNSEGGGGLCKREEEEGGRDL